MRISKLAAGSGSTPIVYATWNPSDKATGITLSGGNLTATTTTINHAVRSTLGKSSGKWYWEVTAGVGNHDVGIANGSLVLTTFVGGDANSLSYDTDGKLYQNNGIVAGTGATYTNGDVIGVAIDNTTGQVMFYKNGALQYTRTHSITGALFAAVSGYSASATRTANFGASAFSYPVPSGFNAGLY